MFAATLLNSSPQKSFLSAADFITEKAIKVCNENLISVDEYLREQQLGMK
jgi:hypothetical protein